MVRVQLYSDHLRKKIPIWTPLMRRDELTVDRIMARVERVMQSSTSFRLDESFRIEVQYTETPDGGGNDNLVIPESVKRLLKNKMSIVRIKNDDNLCLPRSLVTAKALADDDLQLYSTLRDTRAHKHPEKQHKDQQTLLAKQLVIAAGLTERRYSLDDVETFQKLLSDYQIIIVGLEQLNSIIFAGEFREKRLMLLYYANHFDVLTSLQGWYEKSKWCFHCNQGYSHEGDHRCKYTCKLCLRERCELEANFARYCAGCNRTGFRNNECFNHHLAKTAKSTNHNKKKSICEKFKVCIDCSAFIKTNVKRGYGTDHVCGEIYCSVCLCYVLPEHHDCYIKPEKLDDKVLAKHKSASFMYFDFETYPDGNGKHIPNFCVIQVQEDGKPIETRQFPEDISNIGKDIAGDVCEFIFQEKHAGFFCLAHNFRGFDGYFILKWLLQKGQAPDVIMKGSQITHLRDREFGINFRDTLNYVPLSLDNWAKSFAVEETKGKFPHVLNRPQFWNTVIDYPDIEKFNYRFMSDKEKHAFMEFYNEDKALKEDCMTSTRNWLPIATKT
ncbi:uncharacterized protein LOC129585529 [Paramacrobiotus metropolitanus]|uniref:uncharacterized protein LOC129585529 n=1 Tax=Paramacrobiotus metropolitanus TaxID=2943436 RepID=UPI0024456361|nr:uncharacterized protein LOC129585529 [Paramacrobiotus metropolitanus]